MIFVPRMLCYGQHLVLLLYGSPDLWGDLEMSFACLDQIMYVFSFGRPKGFMFEISLLKEYRETQNGLVRLLIMGKLKGGYNVQIHHL